MNTWIYRVGLSQSEVDEDMLKRSNFVYEKVDPRAKIIESAKRAVGAPYKRGASVLKDAPFSFDCSALVAWVAVEAGYSIPRVTVDQYVFLQKISKDDLLPGDAIFVNTLDIVHTEGVYFSQVLGKEVREEPIRYETLEYMPGTLVPEGIDHGAIYIGEDTIIHATSFKGEVIEEKLSTSESFKNELHYARIVEDKNRRFVIEIPADRPDLRNKENLLKEINKHIE
jgi:cell wall-associated NlpC family hydrolase